MKSAYKQASNIVPEPQLLQKISAESSFWRKESPVITDAGLVTGGMWPKQLEWWDLPNFIRLFVGGYGAGKTNVISKRMIGLALINAPAPVACVSPTFPMARETTILTIAELLEGKRSLLGKKFWWKYYHNNNQFKIKYRGRTGRIIIYSGDNPMRLKGPNLAAAGIDEPFIQDIEVFKQIIARIRHPGAVQRELCLTGTPESLNWGYDLCEGELKDDHDVGVVQCSTRQNLALDSGYVERLEASLSDREAEAYVDGAFMNLQLGQIYHAFDPKENVRVEDAPEDALIGGGMDFNVDPMSAALFWQKGERIHFFDEYESPNADTEYLCSEIRDDYGELVTTMFPDASGAFRKTNSPGGKSDFHYIEEAGFDIEAPAKNGLVKDRYNAMNAALKARSGQVKMTVSPKCKKLIKYLTLCTHSQKKKQKAMGHLLDAAGYPVCRLFPVTRETLIQKKLKGF